MPLEKPRLGVGIIRRRKDIEESKCEPRIPHSSSFAQIEEEKSSCPSQAIASSDEPKRASEDSMMSGYEARGLDADEENGRPNRGFLNQNLSTSMKDDAGDGLINEMSALPKA